MNDLLNDMRTHEEIEAEAQAEQEARDQAARRNQCRGSLRAFCETYLPNWFNGFTQTQSELVEILEQVIIEGRTQDRDVDRLIGTTTLIKAAALWAALMGHRRAILIIHLAQLVAAYRTSEIVHAIAHSPWLTRDFQNPLFTTSESIRNRGQGQNLGIPFRVDGRITPPDLILIDTVPELPPTGELLLELTKANPETLAAVRINSVER